MNLIDKVKLLFKIQKPANTIINAAQEARETKKWWKFAITLFGTLATTVGALTGVIPPQAQLIAVTVLQMLYNAMRGLDKADSAAVKGTLRTTEFWLTAFTEVQKGFVALQTGGVNPEWMAASSTMIGIVLAAGQNLAARAPVDQPKTEVPPAA